MNKEELSILLLEDEAGDALILKKLLDDIKQIDYRLERYDRLDNAIETAGARNFDIILLDLNLRDSNGLQTFTTLASAVPDVPVVILTGMDDENLGLRAINDGAQDYLIKGLVDGRLLRRSIFYAIERKKSEEALQKAQAQLEAKVKERTEQLREKSITLKEVLNHIKEAKRETREEYRNFIEKIIFPIVSKLKRHGDSETMTLVKTLEEELKELITQGMDYLDLFSALTPREIEISNLVKNGLTSKEIASELFISPATVNKHRKNIRAKLGIKGRSINLRSFLLRSSSKNEH